MEEVHALGQDMGIHLAVCRKEVSWMQVVFLVTHSADGSVNHFEARLVATGFIQPYGVDYEEIFA